MGSDPPLIEKQWIVKSDFKRAARGFIKLNETEVEEQAIYIDFKLLIARAENDVIRRNNKRAKRWYKFGLDYLDELRNDTFIDEFVSASVTYNLHISFISHFQDNELGKRLFDHCRREIADRGNEIGFSDNEIVSLGKYSEDPLWTINYFLQEASECGDYERIIDIALTLYRLEAIDEANSVLVELLESQGDSVISSNLAARLREYLLTDQKKYKFIFNSIIGEYS